MVFPSQSSAKMAPGVSKSQAAVPRFFNLALYLRLCAPHPPALCLLKLLHSPLEGGRGVFCQHLFVSGSCFQARNPVTLFALIPRRSQQFPASLARGRCYQPAAYSGHITYFLLQSGTGTKIPPAKKASIAHFGLAC